MSNCVVFIEENERESVATIVKEDKEPFQNNIPQGAIVESRPHVPSVYPKEENNHTNNAFVSVAGGMEMKPPHVIDGLPLPYPPGMPRPIMQIDPQQMQMFLMHRHSLRSQHPPIKPPMGASGAMQSAKPPTVTVSTHVMYENGPMLQVTQVTGHEPVPSSTVTVSMNSLTTVGTLPTYNKSIMGYSVPGAVVNNQTGNGTVNASRPVTLALPRTTSICNSTLIYSLAPVTAVSTITSMDTNKGSTGVTVPPLQPMLPTSVVDSNAYIAYHNVQTGSGSFSSNFQGQGGPISVTPAQTPVPTPTHNPAPLQSLGSNVSTPLQTPVTGVSQLPHTLAHIATPPAPPVASQGSQPPNQPSPSCSTCGCNGHCTTASSSNTGYTQVMWHHHPMFPAGYPLGVMPVTSNGLVPSNLPYSHPLQAMNLPNGINPDVVFNNQSPDFNLIQQSDSALNAVFVTSANSGVVSTAPPSHVVPTYTDSTNSKGKIINCYNCGEPGHRAVECSQLTMESLTHNGMLFGVCIFRRNLFLNC